MMRLAAAWFRAAAGRLAGAFDAGDRVALIEMFEARAAAIADRPLPARAWFVGRELASLAWLIFATRLAGANRFRWRDHLGRELRHAVRRLRRSPLLAASTIAMMSLAIGGAVVVFAMLHRVVLSPLPYQQADRLIYLDHAAPGAGVDTLGLSIGLYQQYEVLPSLESAALYYAGVQTLSGRGDAVQLPFLHTTPSLAGVLGIRTALGRWFSEAEGRSGGADVVVLTDALWRTQFGADTAALGASVRLDGRAHQIIGVLAPATTLPNAQAQFVLPLRLPANYRRAAGFNYEGVARLAQGVTLETAREQQNTVIAEIPERFRGDPELSQGLLAEFKLRSSARLLKEQVLGSSGRLLWILFAAAGVVLAIAGANLATLFFARADARMADAALRRALGAHPWVDGIAAVAEPLIVSVAGGAVGLAGAAWCLQRLRAIEGLSLPRGADVRIDAVVIGVTLAAAVAVGLLAGIATLPGRVPAVAHLLDAGRRMTAGSHRAWTRQMMMGVQVALATLLLISASLLLRSASHLRHVDPGFRTADTLAFRLALPRSGYATRASAESFHERLLTALDGTSGFTSASLTTTLPLDGEGIGNPIEINGQPVARVNALGIVRLRRVSNRYFDTMAIPLRRGRTFDLSDTTNVVQAAIVNEAMAARYFPGDDPIGKHVRPANASDRDGWLTIVGVVGNNVTYTLHEPAPIAQLFVPLQGPVRTDVPAVFSATYVVRTAQDSIGAIAAVRRTIAALDPSVALARPEPLTAVIERSQAQVTTTASMLIATAIAAVLLGLIGVYAVVAHNVTQRTAEIGVRMAFGADARHVLGAIAGRSGLAILAGGAAGVVIAAACSTALVSLVHGVTATDPITYATAAAIVVTLSLLACWVPARRAARLDPVEALRR